MKTLRQFILLQAMLLISLSLSSQQKGYYRFPAIHGTDVIFTAEGDLWKYSQETHRCFRLTTSHGVESQAAISHDGKWIAFVGQYEGPSEVYVIPAVGGTPKRLTYEEGSPAVYQWSPDGKILYSTSGYSTLPNSQLIKIDPLTTTSDIIPLSQADQGSYSDKGDLFFTRLRDQGSHTKRYKGGTAQSIWKFDGSNEAKPLTADYPGTSKNPMFWNNRIYFLSDRDGTMNIWSMNTDGGDLKQHTRSAGWDLEEADLDDGKIVCQQGADILLYDINADKSEVLDISLISDFDQKRVQWITDPKSKISSVNLSYKGDHVVITSRGRVFTVPVEGNRWSEVTRKYGIRYKGATYADTGNEIYLLSDESGEFELWTVDNYGFNAPVQVTKGTKDFIEDFSVSPDGNYVVYNEKDNRLLLYSKSAGTSALIAENGFGFRGPFSWSSDSRWIAFADVAENQTTFIKLYDVKAGISYKVTTDRQENYTPRFSRDGKWLYFLSDRTFSTIVRSPWGSRQPEPYYEKTARIYAVALDSKAKFPFAEINELNQEKPDSAKPVTAQPAKKNIKNAGARDAQDKKPVSEIVIDLNDISTRLYTVPVKAANIGNFEINDGWIYWSEYNLSDFTANLNALKITNKPNNETVSISSAISSFALSGDGKKLLVRDRNGIMVLNADGTKTDPKKNSIDLAKWAFKIDPAEDWKQMLHDAWRMERDYFYDRDMHGVDWKKIYDKYSPLVSRLTDRYELDDLLAQMISELSALHMFVYGGDKRMPSDNISNGYLGAVLTRSENRGGYVISHIYRADPDFPSGLSPLSAPGLKIREGDVITAINGVSVMDVPHINVLLGNKADVQVRLRLRNQAGTLYDEVVRPINAVTFSGLRYSDWELSRRERTDSLSGGRIGYLHLRAMGGPDFDDFVKNFYPSIRKEGLIIDMRHNRGGNIDSWVLEKLMRKAWFYWAPRVGTATPNMQYAFTGHLVVLMDENTASDGEAFSEGFRRLGLGKLIGTRTWGGEIWLSSGNRLVDNGIATAAETGVYSPQGEWLIEGWGVEPDIRVDNLPFESFKGRDAQLEAAVQHLMKLISEQPVKMPPVPKYPDKSFNYREP